MDKNRFFEALKNPTTLEQIYFVDIQEVVKEYPYFNAAYLLLARRAKEVYRSDWQDILAKAATYLPNRNRLFAFLNTNPIPLTHTHTTPLNNQDDTENTVAVSVEVVQSVLKNNNITLPPPPPPADIETVIIGGNTSTHAVINLQNEEEEEALSALLEKIKQTENTQKTSITPAALATPNNDSETMLLPLVKNNPSTADNTPQKKYAEDNQQLLDTEEIEEQAIKEVQKLLQHKEQLKNLISDVPDTEKKEQEIAKWIKKDVQNEFEMLKKEVQQIQPEPIHNAPAPELNEQDDLIQALRKKIESHQKTVQPPTEYTQPTPQGIPSDISEKETSLIKQYLENQTLEMPPLQGSVQDMAEESLQKANDLNTETMARIHSRQENFDNALTIYQNLLEKFPEKAAYYTQKIEEIKQRLNDTNQ